MEVLIWVLYLLLLHNRSKIVLSCRSRNGPKELRVKRVRNDSNLTIVSCKAKDFPSVLVRFLLLHLIYRSERFSFGSQFAKQTNIIAHRHFRKRLAELAGGHNGLPQTSFVILKYISSVSSIEISAAIFSIQKNSRFYPMPS